MRRLSTLYADGLAILTICDDRICFGAQAPVVCPQCGWKGRSGDLLFVDGIQTCPECGGDGS